MAPTAKVVATELPLIAAKTAAIFGQKPIDASSLESLEEALYTADFGHETTEEILAEIKAAYKKDKSLQFFQLNGYLRGRGFSHH